MENLKERYKKEIVPELFKNLKCENIMKVPKLEKISINSGISSHRDKAYLKEVVETLEKITGQKTMQKNAKKSIAGFKIREESIVGVCVTLRSTMMYDFLTRLINTAMPRIRDFRGIKRKGFDHRGNFTMGIDDQSIFTEIDLDKISNQIGMNITFVTTAETDEEAMALLEQLGMPFVSESGE